MSPGATTAKIFSPEPLSKAAKSPNFYIPCLACFYCHYYSYFTAPLGQNLHQIRVEYIHNIRESVCFVYFYVICGICSFFNFKTFCWFIGHFLFLQSCYCASSHLGALHIHVKNMYN